jgi:phage baseplate assembly protein gpV
VNAELAFLRLLQRIENQERVINDLNRRINNLVREARVEKVFDDGTAIVEGQGLVSKRVPWVSRAGNIRDWDPPAENERVLLLSPTGEPGKGLILPGGFSNSFPANHDDTGQSRRTLGDTRFTTTTDSYEIVSETVTIEADVVIKGRVTIEGPSVTHNTKEIGHKHKHKDSMPGPSFTGFPA